MDNIKIKKDMDGVNLLFIMVQYMRDSGKMMQYQGTVGLLEMIVIMKDM